MPAIEDDPVAGRASSRRRDRQGNLADAPILLPAEATSLRQKT